jgi:hypothetical protein
MLYLKQPYAVPTINDYMRRFDNFSQVQHGGLRIPQAARIPCPSMDLESLRQSYRSGAKPAEIAVSVCQKCEALPETFLHVAPAENVLQACEIAAQIPEGERWITQHQDKAEFPCGIDSAALNGYLRCRVTGRICRKVRAEHKVDMPKHVAGAPSGDHFSL